MICTERLYYFGMSFLLSYEGLFWIFFEMRVVSRWSRICILNLCVRLALHDDTSNILKKTIGDMYDLHGTICQVDWVYCTSRITSFQLYNEKVCPSCLFVTLFKISSAIFYRLKKNVLHNKLHIGNSSNQLFHFSYITFNAMDWYRINFLCETTSDPEMPTIGMQNWNHGGNGSLPN